MSTHLAFHKKKKLQYTNTTRMATWLLKAFKLSVISWPVIWEVTYQGPMMHRDQSQGQTGICYDHHLASRQKKDSDTGRLKDQNQQNVSRHLKDQFMLCKFFFLFTFCGFLFTRSVQYCIWYASQPFKAFVAYEVRLIVWLSPYQIFKYD